MRGGGGEGWRRYVLGGLEVAVDEGLGLHAVQVGHPLGALEAPAHGVGRCVEGEGLCAVQH